MAEYLPFEYVRTTDPVTSHQAALRVTVTVVQERVWTLLRNHPEGMTDEELLTAYQRQWVTPESSPRKRRCDLTKRGLVVNSGLRRRLKSGCEAIVWRAV